MYLAHTNSFLAMPFGSGGFYCRVIADMTGKIASFRCYQNSKRTGIISYCSLTGACGAENVNLSQFSSGICRLNNCVSKVHKHIVVIVFPNGWPVCYCFNCCSSNKSVLYGIIFV